MRVTYWISSIAATNGALAANADHVVHRVDAQTTRHRRIAHSERRHSASSSWQPQAAEKRRQVVDPGAQIGVIGTTARRPGNCHPLRWNSAIAGTCPQLQLAPDISADHQPLHLRRTRRDMAPS